MEPPNPEETPGTYPPPGVWEACEAAGARADELRAAGVELHFAIDEGSASVVIELRTSEGEVLRKLPVREALAIAEGARVDANADGADRASAEPS